MIINYIYRAFLRVKGVGVTFLVNKHGINMFPSLYYKVTLLIVGQLTYNQKRHKITLRDSKSIAKLTAPLNTASNMKSILLASNFLIVWPVLQNLCEIVTKSGKELKFVENKTVKAILKPHI